MSDTTQPTDDHILQRYAEQGKQEPLGSLLCYLGYAASDSAAPPDDDLYAWVWGLHRWGKPAQVAACLAAGRMALSTLDGYLSSGDWGEDRLPIDRPLRAAEAWLARPHEPQRADAERDAALLARAHERLSLWADEASGTGNIVALRDRACAALESVASALRAAAWDVRQVPCDTDDAEARAHRRRPRRRDRPGCAPGAEGLRHLGAADAGTHPPRDRCMGGEAGSREQVKRLH